MLYGVYRRNLMADDHRARVSDDKEAFPPYSFRYKPYALSSILSARVRVYTYRPNVRTSTVIVARTRFCASSSSSSFRSAFDKNRTTKRFVIKYHSTLLLRRFPDISVPLSRVRSRLSGEEKKNRVFARSDTIRASDSRISIHRVQKRRDIPKYTICARTNTRRNG